MARSTLILLLSLFVSFLCSAEEECAFDEAVYIDFINKYAAENSDSRADPDKKRLVVNRNNEEVTVTGGGCVHLGAVVVMKSTRTYTEQQFLKKVIELSEEFAAWVINTAALKNAVQNGRFRTIRGVYYIEVDAMTVFSASHDSQGLLHIEFYIN